MARAARASARRTKGNVVTIDFTGVEGKRQVPDEGEYLAKVTEAVQEKGGDKGPYISWTLEIVDDKEFEGSTLYNNTSQSQKAKWNLKAWLEALGVEVPDDEMDVDLDDMADRELMVTVAHETFEGTKRARIVDFSPSEEPEPEPKGRRGSARDEPKGERRSSAREERGSGRSSRSSKKDLLKADDLLDMTQKELEDVIEDNKLDVDLADFKSLTKMRNAVIDAAETAKLLEE